MAKTVRILLRNQEEDVKAETTPPNPPHGPIGEGRTRFKLQGWDESTEFLELRAQFCVSRKIISIFLRKRV